MVKHLWVIALYLLMNVAYADSRTVCNQVGNYTYCDTYGNQSNTMQPQSSHPIDYTQGARQYQDYLQSIQENKIRGLQIKQMEQQLRDQQSGTYGR